MILKASQRGGGQDLAAHLMKVDDNEHVLVHELRGFASESLRGAFKESEAISRGTKCRQYLFSLSLSPPEAALVSADEFTATIDRIEERLGLEGQPRAIVLHEKEGRRHAHCVWSRIDAETMTARQMSFYKRKLVTMSRELYLTHGWEMPRGIETAGRRDPTNFSLAEWQQAKRQGTDPRLMKAELQAAWKSSDSARAFGSALEERGYFLARGDRRSFVVLGYDGEVHSLPRSLGLKTKDVAARLGDGADLASVAETKEIIAARMRPAIRRHTEESRLRFRERSDQLGQIKEAMTRRHRAARVELAQRQELEWLAETKARSARLPRGLSGLWQRLTGKYQETRRQNEAEAAATRARHAGARQELADAQLTERQGLQAAFKTLRQAQAAQLLDLRREVGRFLGFTGRREDAAMRERKADAEAPRQGRDQQREQDSSRRRSRDRDQRREAADAAADERRARRRERSERSLSRGLRLER